MPDKKGFTLMEIIVVLIIIGILTIIALPNYTAMIIQGAAKSAQNNLVTIYNAQKNYYFGPVGNSTYCTVTCNSLANINANLVLNISDNNFTYTCTNPNNDGGLTYSCKAQSNSDPNLSLTLIGGPTNNPPQIILPGGVNCASGGPAPCNPVCTDVPNPSYCPS